MLGEPHRPPFDASTLRLAGELRRLRVEPTRGDWHHVRHGVWMPLARWQALDPLDRHAALVHASAMVRPAAQPPVVFALHSAAALWGLPRVERWPAVVRHLVTDRGRRSADILRPHLGPGTEPVMWQGLALTSVARTVTDLARTGSLHTAVAAGDHALRHRLCTREELAAEAAALPPRVRRRGAAALVVDLVDPRSMSVGESLSRAQMFILNVPRPELQVTYTDDDGLIGDVDFGWKGVVGEFDGRMKYAMPEGATPAQAAEVLWREKRREDRLRRQAKVTRWLWQDAMRGARLLVRLGEVGIRPTPRSTWFDLGAPCATA